MAANGEGASTSGQAPQAEKLELAEMLQRNLGLREPQSQAKKHAFWSTQPVVQFGAEGGPAEDGPVDVPKTVADVRADPYNLPDAFEWCTCDLSDNKVTMEVYELLSANYVEDDDNMFRFNYAPKFLRWALQPPGYLQDWHLGVRVKASGKLVGFISAIPASVRANANTMPMVEINFLCVHKKLRTKRLAPVLIKEITRRVNLRGIWQAAYTAGVVIPRPVASCRYWHRSLNPKKLIDVGFSRLNPRMTLARTIKLHKLPDQPLTPGMRPLVAADIPAVARLLKDYQARFKLAPVLSEEELAHWLNPQDDVIEAYVVENPGSKAITDFLSFYSLPSSILGHPEHQTLRAAYMFYTAPGATPLKALVHDMLILAAKKGYDVFNCLNIMQNDDEMLKDLKFGIGDGALQYYLYNWRVAAEMQPSDIGLILM